MLLPSTTLREVPALVLLPSARKVLAAGSGASAASLTKEGTGAGTGASTFTLN